MMNINVKYDIGDVIKYMMKIRHEVFDKCPCCYGDGYVIGQDGRQYECSECEGTGSVSTGKYLVEAQEKEGTISSIHVHFDSNYSSFDGKPKIYYNVPQTIYKIMQEDVIEKIVSQEEKLAYTD